VNAILKEVSGVGAGLDSEEEGEVWGGIQEEEETAEAEEVLDREEEYVDEDRWTTVTVEAVDVSKEGLKKVGEEDSDDAEAPDLVALEEKGEGKEKKKWPKKEKKKKKFRYESKAERKFTRGKQKAGNKARADARKGNS
jgi:ribosomal RNA-processing protein 17